MTDSNISDEPSIFVGLNFDGDSAEEQIQPDPVPVQPEPKRQMKRYVKDMVPQVSASKSSAVSQNKPISLSDCAGKSSKPNLGLASLVSYASSDDDEI